LLYAQSGTLMAAPFDPRRLALTGAAVPTLEGVMQINSTGAAQYDLSSTGTLVYVAGKLADGKSRLVWVSRKGEEQPLPADPHNYVFPRVSPDGHRVAVEIIEQEEQTWIYDVPRDHLTRLAFEGTVNNIPAWSPDGKRVAFSSNRAGVASNVFWALADGSGAAERLTTSEHVNFPNSFSRDGQLLAYVEVTPETGSDIWLLRTADRKGQPFLRAPYEETAPAFSPDGRWLANSSNESGRREIIVQPYPGSGGKWQISTDGGQEPVWNPKGGELFYRNGSKVMAVDVDTKSGFSASKPRTLFEGPYLPGGAFPFFDVSPDGQRLLMLKPVESQTAPTQINVALNWFEELKRLVPSR
jgi:serine/threonine-protein kinase